MSLDITSFGNSIFGDCFPHWSHPFAVARKHARGSWTISSCFSPRKIAASISYALADASRSHEIGSFDLSNHHCQQCHPYPESQHDYPGKLHVSSRTSALFLSSSFLILSLDLLHSQLSFSIWEAYSEEEGVTGGRRTRFLCPASPPLSSRTSWSFQRSQHGRLPNFELRFAKILEILRWRRMKGCCLRHPLCCLGRRNSSSTWIHHPPPFSTPE